MPTDPLVVAINILGAFIRVERPIWLFNLEKRLSLTVGFYPKVSRAIPVVGLAVFGILLAAIQCEGGTLFAAVFFVVILGSTCIALLKLINAAVPPQRKVEEFVTVLDALVVSEGGEGSSKDYVLMKVNTKDLGVRVLPACSYSSGVALHLAANLPVFCRMGGLGYLYRFVFDGCVS